MINHVRTLLLNRNGASRPAPGFFGEEVVPETYSALPLPQGLLTVRNALFGSTPDDAGMNYQLWHYMRILHTTEFESYVTALDPRITYLHDKSLLDFEFGPLASPDDNALNFVGTPGLGGRSGKLETAWLVTRRAGGVFDIDNLQSGHVETYSPVIADGVTELMPMTDYKDLQVRVFTGEATTTTWSVTYLERPGAEMDPINRAAQLMNIGASAYLELFPNREPFTLFKELWERHSQFPYKLSGALLALAYRTEEIRLGRAA